MIILDFTLLKIAHVHISSEAFLQFEAFHVEYPRGGVLLIASCQMFPCLNAGRDHLERVPSS